MTKQLVFFLKKTPTIGPTQHNIQLLENKISGILMEFETDDIKIC